MSELGFSTRAVHAGFDPDPQTGAVNVPIYASSTFAQDGVGGLRDGYEYGRTGNPTRTALEANLAALEAGRYGRAFASGMAATDCALRATLRPGDHIVIPDDAYGGTFRLIDKVFSQWGIEHSPAHVFNVDEMRAAIRPNTKLVWIETPTNPLLSIGDIPALADVAHAAGAKLVV
ncbi:aminotransferase class I/II-fold pyridoxal phosphate-dependent enzyme, partial [Nocardia cyriacigeorgica]